MDEQIFADGIGSISVIGGTVRLDLVALSPTERDAAGKPKLVFRQRIVMSADGFVHSAQKVQEAALALSKIGTAQQPANQVPALHRTPDPVAPVGGPIGGTEIAPPQRREAVKPPFP